MGLFDIRCLACHYNMIVFQTSEAYNGQFILAGKFGKISDVEILIIILSCFRPNNAHLKFDKINLNSSSSWFTELASGKDRIIFLLILFPTHINPCFDAL